MLDSPTMPSLVEPRYGFVAAGLRLLATKGTLTELLLQATVYPIPHSAQALLGVINHRGSTVAVFDVTAQPKQRVNLLSPVCNVLVFGEAEHRVGLVLQEAPQLMEIEPVHPVPDLPASHLQAFLKQAWLSSGANAAVWWDFDYQAAFRSLGINLPL